MKKFLALFLAIVIAITLVSCLDQKDTPTPAPDASPDGGDASTTTTTTTTKKDNTPKIPLGYTSSGGDGSPQIMISFSSIEDIQDFIAAANGTEEEFDKYHKEEIAPLLGITYKVSQAAAHNLGLIELPSVDSTKGLEDFGATYYLSSNILDILYRVNGVRYRFKYYYNESTLPISENIPIKENISLGSYSLDLYKREDGGFVGLFLDNSIRVSVIIYIEDFESVSLDMFEMLPIDSIK